ncbi:MAG: ABC transporter ATP-binding protein [Silanimonas sp.]
MSSELVVRARGIGKRFVGYAKPHHRLLQAIDGRARGHHHVALEGIDLDVRRGETVGIVGRNGSGKSTLLQIVCGTLQASTGDLAVTGRVAALLELGAGFNPEFTGRENVYLNAALMGMARAEVDARLDGILAFADIGGFIDQPVRTYSSGMYVRLAFAVAISVEPDLLVVDEALAVGDEAFQRKCYARIEQLKAGGTAILFVSHSAATVVQLCDRAILLERGRKLLDGPPKPVVGQYQRLLYARDDQLAEVLAAMPAGAELSEESRIPGGLAASSPGPDDAAADDECFDPSLKSASVLEYASRGARIIDPHLENLQGERVNVLAAGRTYVYRYDVHIEVDAARVHFGMMVKSVSGIELFGMSSHRRGEAIPRLAAGTRLQVRFHFRASLLPGAYCLNAGCVGVDAEGEEVFLHRILDAVLFRVETRGMGFREMGYVDLSTPETAEWMTIA